MSRSALPEHARNGGFPEPPADEIVRVVSARHDGCGRAVRVRLPSSVPVRAVRRLHCPSCAEAFEARGLDEIAFELPELDALPVALPGRRFEHPAPAKPEPAGPVQSMATEQGVERQEPAKADAGVTVKAEAAEPKPKISTPRTKPKAPARRPAASRTSPAWLRKLRAPKLGKFDPQSRSWRLLSIVVAGVLVIAGLLLLRGGGDPSPRAGTGGARGAGGAAKPHAARAKATDPKVLAKASKDATLVTQSSYSLALPAGWERIQPPSGATFAAVSAGNDADATLWITQDPKLDPATFLSQSEAQLEALAGAPPKVEQSPASSPQDTVYTLTAPAPPGQPTYQVTLRSAAPYSYYLATTLQPDASPEAIAAVDLITGSLTPAPGR